MDRLFLETHALKGTAAYAHAMDLTMAVNALQQRAGAYEHFSDVCRAYETFERAAERVQRFLSRHSFTKAGDQDHFRIW